MRALDTEEFQRWVGYTVEDILLFNVLRPKEFSAEYESGLCGIRGHKWDWQSANPPFWCSLWASLSSGMSRRTGTYISCFEASWRFKVSNFNPDKLLVVDEDAVVPRKANPRAELRCDLLKIYFVCSRRVAVIQLSNEKGIIKFGRERRLESSNRW